MTEENKRLWQYYRWMISEMRNIKQAVNNYPTLKAKPTEKDWENMRKIKGV